MGKFVRCVSLALAGCSLAGRTAVKDAVTENVTATCRLPGMDATSAEECCSKMWDATDSVCRCVAGTEISKDTSKMVCCAHMTGSVEGSEKKLCESALYSDKCKLPGNEADKKEDCCGQNFDASAKVCKCLMAGAPLEADVPES